jgi:hypothetical protein
MGVKTKDRAVRLIGSYLLLKVKELMKGLLPRILRMVFMMINNYHK